MKIRMTEHKQEVKNKDPNNGIAMHVHKTDRSILWQDARILEKEELWEKRRINEDLQIQEKKHTMNLDAGLLLDQS